MKKTDFKKLNKVQQELLEKAFEAMKNSYNPYSNFYVGAAILSDDERMVGGANVENAAYGTTVCAECSALVRARAEGIKKIIKVAVIGRNSKQLVSDPVSPCGACRQMIFEFSQVSDFDIEVIMSNTKMDKIIIAKISELLPLGFGPKSFDKI
ncbi:cytidine deaminase [Candidatus Falkowbacteria bacterium HGW-Falkowbacteria-1]|jgi:cytidine deaminase|uniref:Cytidine deaminase n=1 Tax=Candidatus Falkowbacteria bacterium HGW-Falkowbacteria-1 TaxID=2013768 RepID=A0A2N2EAE6_9BACT|nr:MAG: cytidine deaminase [Candidatus Falkowbacteria bacterium HGW-Falkowbacteria-1]